VRPLLVEHHQAIRLGDRQPAQQDLVDEREDGGVGADAKGERQDGDGGEERAAAQPAKSQPQISSGSGHASFDGSRPATVALAAENTVELEAAELAVERIFCRPGAHLLLSCSLAVRKPARGR